MAEIKSIYDLVEDGTLSIEQVYCMAQELYLPSLAGVGGDGKIWLNDIVHEWLFDPIANPEQQLAVIEWCVNEEMNIRPTIHYDEVFEYEKTRVKGFAVISREVGKVIECLNLIDGCTVAMAAALEGE